MRRDNERKSQVEDSAPRVKSPEALKLFYREHELYDERELYGRIERAIGRAGACDICGAASKDECGHA